MGFVDSTCQGRRDVAGKFDSRGREPSGVVRLVILRRSKLLLQSIRGLTSPARLVVRFVPGVSVRVAACLSERAVPRAGEVETTGWERHRVSSRGRMSLICCLVYRFT